MALSSFQERVLQLARDGADALYSFVLAGGGALNAHGIVARPTDDLDLFTTEPRDVALAAAQVQTALKKHRLAVVVVRSGASFTRLRVTDPTTQDQTLIDLAWDTRLDEPTETAAGPTVSIRELAADKVLALFGRAEARDLMDVHALVEELGAEAVLAAAAEKDQGFDVYVLTQMVVVAEQRPDADFGLEEDELGTLRSWSREWRTHLATGLLN